MQELFFVFSLVMGLGLLTYGAVVLALKMDQSEGNLEVDHMKDMLEMIQSANAGTKLTVLFMFGGMMLTEVAVKLIDVSFVIFSALVPKKSA